jgi:hypothetical protein
MAADAECPGNNTYSLLFLFQLVLPIIKMLWSLTIEIERGFKWITKRTKGANSTPTIAVQTAVKQNSLYVLLSAHMWYLKGLLINIKRINNRVRWPSVSYVKEGILSQQKV